MSSFSENNSEFSKSVHNLNLFDYEPTTREEGIQINFSNASERENDDQSSQGSSSNLSTPSYQSYFMDDENRNECGLAKLMFLSNLYISCKKCYEYYSLKFPDLNHITIECGCKLIKNCLINNFILNYCSKLPPNKYGCKWHDGERIEKYCKDCKMNLCHLCLSEKSDFYNYSGQHTKHETHTLINLLEVKKEIEEIKKKLLKDEQLYYLDSNDNIKNILESLINGYDTFPSYNGYKTIKKFLKKLPYINQKNEDLNYEELYVIKSLEKLKKKIDDPNLIYKIRINGEKTKEIMDNLSLFDKKDFINLKELTMNNIKLIDITALSNCHFPNLKVFDLESNFITNDCLKVLKTLDLPKVSYFSLFDNKITSPEIFKVIEKYLSLTKFYIGKNSFDENMLKNDKNKYQFPPKLVLLGISNNFTKETNNFIFNNLNIENIKNLYIYANGFDSLEQFEQIKFKNLEEFWFRGNKNKGFISDIKEINHLNEKGNIIEIVLKENNIKNIEELVNIIPSFPNLKILNLEDNPIDRDKIEEVWCKIKKIKGFENLIIKSNQKLECKKIYFKAE